MKKCVICGGARHNVDYALTARALPPHGVTLLFEVGQKVTVKIEQGCLILTAGS